MQRRAPPVNIEAPRKSYLERRGLYIVAEFSCNGLKTPGAFNFIGGINNLRPDGNDLNDTWEFARASRAPSRETDRIAGLIERSTQMKQWYEELFENSAKSYDQQPFVEGTHGEVDFIEEELGFSRSSTILDIGCGTGRHAIELAKRGYTVTAVDLSTSQLDRAREKAIAANVTVQFVEADARHLNYSGQFDAVIIVCEGAFPLMETDEMNFEILKNAFCALRQGGVFILTTLNGLFPLFHSVRDCINEHQDCNSIKASLFDLMTFRDYSEYEHVDDNGNKRIIKCSQRYYLPTEIMWLLKMVGFAEIDIYAAELGNWSRDKKLTSEDLEMLVVTKKE
ncbi:MAG: methyltransferase domain-containing protein [Halobacteriota archaeon]